MARSWTKHSIDTDESTSEQSLSAHNQRRSLVACFSNYNKSNGQKEADVKKDELRKREGGRAGELMKGEGEKERGRLGQRANVHESIAKQHSTNWGRSVRIDHYSTIIDHYLIIIQLLSGECRVSILFSLKRERKRRK